MDAAARTAAFYEWEIRGRGWLSWDYPVRLEPPYRPYRVGGLVAGQTKVIDDGQRHSSLSAWVESFTRRQIAPVEESFEEKMPEEAEVLAFERTQILLPVATAVGLPGILSWLHSLSGVRSAMALEIECSERGIEIYLSGSADDLRFAQPFDRVRGEARHRREPAQHPDNQGEAPQLARVVLARPADDQQTSEKPDERAPDEVHDERAEREPAFARRCEPIDAEDDGVPRRGPEAAAA